MIYDDVSKNGETKFGGIIFPRVNINMLCLIGILLLSILANVAILCKITSNNFLHSFLGDEMFSCTRSVSSSLQLLWRIREH